MAHVELNDRNFIHNIAIQNTKDYKHWTIANAVLTACCCDYST